MWAVDNDIVIKLSIYDLLTELSSHLGPAALLGTARYVVRAALQRYFSSSVLTNYRERFEELLESAVELEPDEDEIALAVSLEEAAMQFDLPFDSGESLLVAIVLTRSLQGLLSGDKRAIASVESLLGEFPQLGVLAGKVVSLEQLMWELAEHTSWAHVTVKVQAEPKADRTLKICFGQPDQAQEALRSYIQSLRASASTILAH